MKELSECRVLLVDDVKTNVDILARTLKRLYKLSVALDGESALQSVQSDPPDLILLDIMMPGMDGYEVCRRLKSAPETEDIPVLFVTAKDESSDKAAGFEIGAVDYITKPYDILEVKARVKTHLTLRHALQRVKAQNTELLEAAALREDVERISRHDLKTPLNALVGVPEIIAQEGNLNPHQRQMLSMIEQAGYQMIDMINRSLDLFKMERGTYEFTPEPVNLIQTVARILEETQRLAMGMGLTVSVTVNGNPVRESQVFTVEGEELLCYSLLANLLKNAMEASPKDGCVTVAFESGETALVRVHNSGTVPIKIRERFFDKYVTAGKQKGTGLGTYSAKLIAETQRGSIELEASDTEGTAVVVRLPHCSEETSDDLTKTTE